MANVTFDVAMAVSAFVSVFACFHSRQQLHVAMEEMRTRHAEILGEIQGILAGISGDLDRLGRLIPEDSAAEARDAAQRLVRAMDELVLITRADWRR
jgi:hypothetical protein